ncbi:MAG TPA: DHA2 family efflux MFS transporter permease subunit [Streptosporangiaceae bacterium]|nr:DHA2 family efflux MFS transporter permease subunit [Streptosporangiaceae bacterium]
MRKHRGNPWVVLVVMSLGFFMTLLDLTIVNIAIPNMITKLHASLDGILWVINAYALVLAVLLITAGRLGDLRGQRKMFIIGVVTFTLASAACGLSPTVGWLVGFRAVQGVGAALLMPQTLAILTTVFPPERRGAAFGIWGAVAGVATIAGPTLGGLLVSAFDWRYIFYINVPIGIIVIVMSLFLVPDVRTGAQHKLDIAGVLLASLALLAICYGLVEGQKYDWGHIVSFLSIPLVIGIGVVLLALFLFVQARTQDQEPLVPFSLFRDRNFSLMNWVSGAVSVGMMGIFLPFTIYLQSALGFSALKAGLTMAPASIVSMFVAPAAGRLTDRIGGKYILFVGLLFFAGGMGLTAAIATTHSTWQDFVPTLALAGFGMGCTFAPMTTTAMRSVQPRTAGAASGMINTVRQVGAVLGTAAVGALLQNRLAVSLPDAARTKAAALPAAVRGPFVRQFVKAAKSGSALSPVQHAAKPTPGTPPSLIAEIGHIAHDVFASGYVTAMHLTIIMPVAVIAIAGVSCLAIKKDTHRARPVPAESAPIPEASQATA